MTRAQALTTTPGTAITQTYSTTAAVVPAAVSPLVTTATNIAAATPSLTLSDAVNTNAGTVATSLNQAQADIASAHNALVADVLALKKLLNTIINELKLDGTLS